jgi:hypothetical protein
MVTRSQTSPVMTAPFSWSCHMMDSFAKVPASLFWVAPPCRPPSECGSIYSIFATAEHGGGRSYAALYIPTRLIDYVRLTNFHIGADDGKSDRYIRIHPFPASSPQKHMIPHEFRKLSHSGHSSIGRFSIARRQFSLLSRVGPGKKEWRCSG